MPWVRLSATVPVADGDGRQSGQMNDARVGAEARQRQVGGLRDLGLERRELVAGGVEVALDLDDVRGERRDLI